MGLGQCFQIHDMLSQQSRTKNRKNYLSIATQSSPYVSLTARLPVLNQSRQPCLFFILSFCFPCLICWYSRSNLRYMVSVHFTGPTKLENMVDLSLPSQLVQFSVILHFSPCKSPIWQSSLFLNGWLAFLPFFVPPYLLYYKT